MPDLTLRPRTDADLPTLWRWTHAEPDAEWRHWDGPYFSRQQPFLSYEAYAQQERRQPPQPHRRMIVHRGQAIGMVSRYEELPTGGGWWELGLVIYDPQHWSGGLGTRALRQWTRQTFAETAAHVLTLTTWSGNERMVRAAARVGFAECARIPEARAWQGQRWDSVKLAALRRDWPEEGPGWERTE